MLESPPWSLPASPTGVPPIPRTRAPWRCLDDRAAPVLHELAACLERLPHPLPAAPDPRLQRRERHSEPRSSATVLPGRAAWTPTGAAVLLPGASPVFALLALLTVYR